MSDVIPAAPSPWCAVGASVIGAAHARAGKPKQDALGWRPAQGRSVALAVADGHGSPKCFRSERGAQFAVDVALSLLTRLIERAGNAAALAELRVYVKETLPQEIVEQWRRLVEADLAREPITEEEWATLTARDGEAAQLPVRAEPALAYGSTLLSAAATPYFLLVMQNGDGDILSVSRQGVVARPLPGDARLIANETTSLCSPDAAHNFRIAFHEMTATPPALIILSTDGYANSFQDEEGFLQVGADLLALIAAHGLGQVTANLEDWLEHASKEGSGDDVTLGLLAYQPAGGDVPPTQAWPETRSKPLTAALSTVETAVPAALPEQVVRPATAAVTLPRASAVSQAASARQTAPVPQTTSQPYTPSAPLPQPFPTPAAPPKPSASPVRSVLTALGVLLLALVLLFIVFALGKHRPPAHTDNGPGTSGSHSGSAQVRSVDLGTIAAGTSVPLPISRHRSLRYTLRPAPPGVTLRSERRQLMLAVGQDAAAGPFAAKVWVSGGSSEHPVLSLTGNIASPMETTPSTVPQESAPTVPADSPSPPGKSTPDGKSATPPLNGP